MIDFISHIIKWFTYFRKIVIILIFPKQCYVWYDLWYIGALSSNYYLFNIKNTDFMPSKCIACKILQLRKNKSQLRLVWYYPNWTWTCILAIILIQFSTLERVQVQYDHILPLYCLATDYHKFSSVKLHFLLYSFHGSGIQTCISWVLCSPRLQSRHWQGLQLHFKLGVPSQTH